MNFAIHSNKATVCRYGSISHSGALRVRSNHHGQPHPVINRGVDVPAVLLTAIICYLL